MVSAVPLARPRCRQLRLWRRTGAVVQKEMLLRERKIQRLFRDGNVTRLIKKSNDFGAGVSVWLLVNWQTG